MKIEVDSRVISVTFTSILRQFFECCTEREIIVIGTQRESKFCARLLRIMDSRKRRVASTVLGACTDSEYRADTHGSLFSGVLQPGDIYESKEEDPPEILQEMLSHPIPWRYPIQSPVIPIESAEVDKGIPYGRRETMPYRMLSFYVHVLVASPFYRMHILSLCKVEVKYA